MKTVERFTIISQAGRKCPWCVRAARLLDERGLAYSLRPLDYDILVEEARFAKMKTVPIVYHGQRLVGGFTELEAYLKVSFA